ncbi:ADP-ribosylglycohydrolase family protein [Saccharopolyspora sp. 5N102]|uniref:ADP-ribosylglycohydrolase family protein n=1 Tax=Saccharopolyspora sp. 5N102 TaxID=3375155 RepID=UPI0037B1EEC2
MSENMFKGARVHMLHRLAPEPLPEITESAQEYARNNPNSWMYYTDHTLPKDAPVTSQNVAGGRYIGENGEFTGETWVNDAFLPQPAFAKRRFHSQLDLVLWRLIYGYTDLGAFARVFAEASVFVLADSASDDALRINELENGKRAVVMFTSAPLVSSGDQSVRQIAGLGLLDLSKEDPELWVDVNPSSDGEGLRLRFLLADLATVYGQVQTLLREAVDARDGVEDADSSPADPPPQEDRSSGSAQDSPADTDTDTDTEHQRSKLTALEQAIERYAGQQGPIEDVYREFLVTDLLLISSPDSPQPAMFNIEGQPKEQIWVCTGKNAVPDFAPGTTPVNGYQLLPLLAERNVHIATGGGVHDLMLIGERAILHSAPEITDAMRAEGAQKPGTWLAIPDRMYRGDSRENIPEQAFVGEYWVDESGIVTSQYRPNPGYRPTPVTLGFPQPESMLEKVLHLHTTGYVSNESLVSVVNQSEFALVVEEDGAAPLFPLGEKRVIVAASGVKYVPDFAKGAAKATTAAIRPMLGEADLIIDLGTRHQAHISGTLLLAALDSQEAEQPSKNQAQPQTVPPRQPEPVEPPNPQERFVGSMVAGAMGDALGFAIEFHDIGMIRRHHGDAGLTSPVLRDGVAQVSDDTQMMLFTLEGLIRAHVARRINPTDNDPVPEVQHAYQRWFHTQSQPWDRAGGPYAQHLQQPDGWLITHPELFSSRAPGSTCMSALANFARTHQHATPQFKINDSKGCGGVMRAAPVAVWSNDPAEVFYAAVGTAALTHSHPSGYLSAGVLSVIVHQLIRDVPLPESVRMARDLLLRWRGHEEQLKFLDAAVELAKKGAVSPEEIKDTLGQGWVGEEALAIGLYAALATDNLRDALLLSVNHSGDSDSTGIVCGNIAGALYGARAVPPEWLASLELRELVETLAKDALVEFSPGPPTDPGWTRRYPAW